MSDWFSLAPQYLFWLVILVVIKLHVHYHLISILSVNCFWYTSFYYIMWLQGETNGWFPSLDGIYTCRKPDFKRSSHPPQFVCLFIKYSGFNLSYEYMCIIPSATFNTFQFLSADLPSKISAENSCRFCLCLYVSESGLLWWDAVVSGLWGNNEGLIMLIY